MGPIAHAVPLSTETILGWCYVRLGQFGEIQMLRHEGVRPKASVYDLIYIQIESVGNNGEMLHGAAHFNGRRVLAFSKPHSSGVSRVYIVVARLDGGSNRTVLCSDDSPSNHSASLMQRSAG